MASSTALTAPLLAVVVALAVSALPLSRALWLTGLMLDAGGALLGFDGHQLALHGRPCALLIRQVKVVLVLVMGRW